MNMNTKTQRSSDPLVLKLDDIAATLPLVGGKGASLARIARSGFPVLSSPACAGPALTEAGYDANRT